jgi:hypothetical protein
MKNNVILFFTCQIFLLLLIVVTSNIWREFEILTYTVLKFDVTLKMETQFISETSAALLTSTRRNQPNGELTSL